MIDLKLVQKQPEVLAKALADRQSPLKVDEFLELDGRRRALLAEVESLKQQQNAASRQVAQIKREGGDASHMMEELGALSARIKALDVQTAEAKAAVENWLMGVPNIPDASVPVGKDETENVEVLRWGTPRQFDFDIRQHWELGGAALDFERATRLAGSRFALYMGWAARLDRALVNFFLDQHVKHEDYIEVCPPFMVNRATMTGTGQLPKFEEDLFKMPAWDYYLIPTAEVPLTNIHAGEVLDEADLPRAYCAATPCFRSEAGAAGKDTRGLIRLHQFTKVEMVRFAHPDDSFNQLEIMVGHARTLLEKLELPYRVITLCTGDMGFGSAKTYDLEVWLPAQNTYREISSCSNCIDFQARRADIRFKPKGGKSTYCHTLNGSGLPSRRTAASCCPRPWCPTWTAWKSSSLRARSSPQPNSESDKAVSLRGMPPFFVPVLRKTPGPPGKRAFLSCGGAGMQRGKGGDTCSAGRGAGGPPGAVCCGIGGAQAFLRTGRRKGPKRFARSRACQGVLQSLPSAGASGCAAGRGKAGHAAAVRSRIKKAACRVRGRPWSPPVAGGPAPRGVGAGGGSFKRGDYCFCTVMERAAGASGCLRGMTMVSTPFLWLALMFSTSASSARPIWRQKEP